MHEGEGQGWSEMRRGVREWGNRQGVEMSQGGNQSVCERQLIG